MKFIVVEKRDADRYVLHDVQNKGKACASKYTIKQLVENGHEVVGWNNGKVTVYSVTGEISTRETKFSLIPDTKRSLATFEKGIKQTRAEKSANKEKAAKKKATIKEQKDAEKKLAEEMRIKTVRRLKSKPLFKLIKQELWASEYDDGGKYIYEVYFDTPAARSIVNKMRKREAIHMYSFSDEIVSGCKVYSDGPLMSELYDCQVVAGSEVVVDFENYYTSESVFVRYYSWQKYEYRKSNASFHHAEESIRLGSCASGGHTLQEEGRYLRKQLGNIA